MQLTRELAKGQVIALEFFQGAVTASQTDVKINEGSNQISSGFVMPFDGEIIAVGANLSAAATAGQLTVGAFIGTTENANTTLTITTASNGYQRVPRGRAVFTAGQLVGAEITTNAAWNATTAKLVVIVYVQLNLSGI